MNCVYTGIRRVIRGIQDNALVVLVIEAGGRGHIYG